MPSQRQLDRYALGGVPQYPQYRGGRGSSISELLMRQGDIEAQSALESGAIWANALGNIGQTLGAGLKQHAEEKQIKKRDAAWLSALEDPEFWKDPKQAYVRTKAIWGPQADEQFRGALSVHQLMQPKRDPEADRKAAAYTVRAMKGMDPAARAVAWPKIAPAFNQAVGAEVAPGEYSDEFFNKSALPFADQILGAPKTRAVKTRRADGSEVEQIVEDVPGQFFESAPPEPKRHMVTTTGPGGGPMQRLATEEELAAGVPGYRAPTQGREPPRPVQVETVGPDGKPVTMFVNPTAGASYPKPTGSGKPATGQQRKALNYFNRGKEAEEIASDLEEGNKISATKIKYTPEWLNVIRSKPDQAYIQAQRAFTEARLRKDSGAAIKDEEYEADAITYFKQPGDNAATVAQKRAGRRAILAGVAHEAGDALREFFGDEAEGMVERYRRGGGAAGPKAGMSPAEEALLKKYGY